MLEINKSKRNVLLLEIAKKIQDKSISLYLGAGVSVQSDVSSWKDIVSECCAEINLNVHPHEDNYYKLLEYYSIEKSRDEIVDKFKNAINVPESKIYENSVIKSLALLNFNKVWTTNFDNIIHQYLKNNLITSNTIRNDADFLTILQTDGISIIKLNGDFEGGFQVITESDFQNYKTEMRSMYLNFLAEVSTHSILIVGTSLSDGLLLSALHEVFCNNKNHHKSYIFQIVPSRKNDNEETYAENIQRFKFFVKYLENNYNIHSVLCNSSNEIPSLLDTIYNFSLHSSCYISGSLPQMPRSEQTYLEDQSRLLCGKLAQKLIEIGIKVNTCFGMLIGNYISFPIINHCFEKGIPVHKFLQIFPLDNNLDDKKPLRKKIISKGKFFIVLGGSASKYGGTYEEYTIALEEDKIIIPLPTLGGCGKLIYDEVKASGEFVYLTNFINALDSDDLDIVVEAVCKIILLVAGNQYTE